MTGRETPGQGTPGQGGSSRPAAPGARDASGEADLSAQLGRLDARLTELRSERSQDTSPRSRLAEDGTAMARGMKMVSEFVGGIAAGGLLGWLVDRFAGTQPFGLFVGLMFGFAAGLRNLYRATRRSAGPPG